MSSKRGKCVVKYLARKHLILITPLVAVIRHPKMATLHVIHLHRKLESSICLWVWTHFASLLGVFFRLLNVTISWLDFLPTPFYQCWLQAKRKYTDHIFSLFNSLVQCVLTYFFRVPFPRFNFLLANHGYPYNSSTPLKVVKR